MAKINLKQMAEALGVSVSTISKALRNSYEISDETKKKVLEKAEEMGYVGNPYAGSLRHHKSKTIGLIVPELTNNFFIQAISGAESVVQEKDYHILVYNSQDDYEKEKSILKHLRNGRVDGILMSLASTTPSSYEHLTKTVDEGIPIVFFDRICHEIETGKVTTDDFLSSFNATEFLIQQGCRDIAFLALSDHLSIVNKRKQGYLEALNKHDIIFNPDRILKCTGEEKSDYQKIKKLLQGPNVPDAIFASVEKLALTVYYVCGELQVNIPEKLKLLCFSNLRTAPLLKPSLTTITQPAFEIGATAANLLLKNLSKKRTLIDNENIVLKSTLIKRDSTRSSS
jgi:LacI family transcriptional regulator